MYSCKCEDIATQQAKERGTGDRHEDKRSPHISHSVRSAWLRKVHFAQLSLLPGTISTSSSAQGATVEPFDVEVDAAGISARPTPSVNALLLTSDPTTLSSAPSKPKRPVPPKPSSRLRFLRPLRGVSSSLPRSSSSTSTR